MTGLLVEDPGFFTTVQDAGRPGFRAWGVPVGGPFDRGSAMIANALVGNDNECAVLELTMRGGVYRAACPLALALAGAPIQARIESPGRITRELVIPSCFTMLEGERLVIGRPAQGIRSYLAVRGGWNTPARLASRSAEHRLPVGTFLPASPSTTLTRRPNGLRWIAPNSGALRLINGPDAHLMAKLGQDFWSDRHDRIGPQSNRMGLRLEGPPIPLETDPERLSTPVAPCAIQLAGGQLIILGVAGGTMGGYPHVAHVISADLDRLGQLGPGDHVRFQVVGIDEARSLDREYRQRLAAWAARLAVVSGDG